MTGPFTILLAEDDEDDLMFFQEALSSTSKNGQKKTEAVIIPVTNGIQALEYLSKAAVDSIHPLPDMIVMDLNMPILNGISTLKEIKKVESIRNIPVYILTTSRDERQKKLCEELGSKGIFLKGSHIGALQITIEEMIASL